MDLVEHIGPGIGLPQGGAPRAIGRIRRAGQKFNQVGRVGRGEGDRNFQVGIGAQKLADHQVVLDRQKRLPAAVGAHIVARSGHCGHTRVVRLRPVVSCLRVLVQPVTEHARRAAGRLAVVVLQGLNHFVAQHGGIVDRRRGLLKIHIVQICRSAHRLEGNLRRAGRRRRRLRGRAGEGVLGPGRGQLRSVAAAVESARRRTAGRSCQGWCARCRLGPERKLVGAVHQNKQVVAILAVEVKSRVGRRAARRRVQGQRLRPAGRAQVGGIGKKLPAAGYRSPHSALRTLPPRLGGGKRRLADGDDVAHAEGPAARRGNREQRRCPRRVRGDRSRAAQFRAARLGIDHLERRARPVVGRRVVVGVRLGKGRRRSRRRQNPDLLAQHRLKSRVDRSDQILQNLAAVIVVDRSDIHTNAIGLALDHRAVVQRQRLSRNRYRHQCHKSQRKYCEN